MNKAWLGIDTSNYTTSVSAVLESGEFYNIKIPLCVKANEKGVRQSDAVFMHVKNLPQATTELFSKIKGCQVLSVGVSTRPRSLEGSYMPCFLSGVSVASSIASALGVPFYEFSHQEGHIRAGLFGANSEIPEHFYSFHLSGGTCELLDVKRTTDGFEEEIISSSADITLGQLVDRVGVMLGLNFPCGVELEKLALQSERSFKIKITGDSQINLSGFENKAQRMAVDNESPIDIAKFVYDVIMSAIEKMLTQRAEPTLPVLFAGGVSGSSIVQSGVSSYCKALFAPPLLSSDNAVGIALLTREKYLKGLKNER